MPKRINRGIDMELEFRGAKAMGELEAASKKDFMNTYAARATDHYIRQAAGAPMLQAALIYNKSRGAGDEGSGVLSHMFDYSKSSGSGGMGFDPTAPLWQTRIMPPGDSNNKVVSFVMLPSMRRVPKITRANDKVPSSVAAKRKKQPIFKNKAVVIESGKKVQIKPRAGTKALFIPKARMHNPELGDEKENFIMYSAKARTITMQPGKKNKGQFTAFFFGYWNGSGGKLVEQKVNEAFYKDFGQNLSNRARERGGAFVPVQVFFRQVEAESKATQQKLLRRFRDQVGEDKRLGSTRREFG